MPSVRLALISLCSLAGIASAQFIPGVTTTSGMGTFSSYNLLTLTNGLGLSAQNLSGTHSGTWQEMWLSNSIVSGWLQFDLGSVQPLNVIAVWNYNSSISTGRGVQLMDVSLSIDGVNFSPLSQEIVPRGTTQPLPAHLIGVGGLPARWVRFDVRSNYGDTYTGLSEVQFEAGSGAAANYRLGQGCIRSRTSFYEFFGLASSFDLANSSFTMLPSGPGYLVIAGTSAFIPPTAAATSLALANNAQVTVPLTGAFPYPGGTATSFSVCSNGYVAVAPGNSTAAIPVVATMLNAPQTAWWAWKDYNPAAVGGGAVKFEQLGALACVTWDGVWDSGGTTVTSANTFQLQFDTSSGNVHYVFQGMSGLGTAHLVGYSPGGNSVDHSSMDLSAAIPGSFSVGASDVLPLNLIGGSRPVIGTTWTLNVSNVPAGGTLGIDVLGLSDPGIADLGFMGAPTCGQRSSLDVLNVWLVSGTTHSNPVTVPNNPVLANLSVFTMAVVLQPGVNTLFGGTITSNGINGRIGAL